MLLLTPLWMSIKVEVEEEEMVEMEAAKATKEP